MTISDAQISGRSITDFSPLEACAIGDIAAHSGIAVTGGDPLSCLVLQALKGAIGIDTGAEDYAPAIASLTEAAQKLGAAITALGKLQDIHETHGAELCADRAMTALAELAGPATGCAVDASVSMDMAAVLAGVKAIPGDIETYRVMAISTAHLSVEDRDALQALADNEEEHQVMARAPGFFIKLYCDDGVLHQLAEWPVSNGLRAMLLSAWRAGFLMVEFDCDAAAIDTFPTYDW